MASILPPPASGIAHQNVWPVSFVAGALGVRSFISILLAILSPVGCKCSVMTSTTQGRVRLTTPCQLTPAVANNCLLPPGSGGVRGGAEEEREAGERTSAHMACLREHGPRLSLLLASTPTCHRRWAEGRQAALSIYPSPSRVMWRQGSVQYNLEPSRAIIHATLPMDGTGASATTRSVGSTTPRPLLLLCCALAP